jgi:hypothetical protein
MKNKKGDKKKVGIRRIVEMIGLNRSSIRAKTY